VVGNARGLLHVVGYNHNGEFCFQFQNQFLTRAVAMGSRAEAGSSMRIFQV